MLCIWKKYIFILLQSLSKYLHSLFRYKSFIWIVRVCSILPHWAIHLGIIIKHNEKSIQTKPSERRKPDFWAWQTLNACSSQCLLQELQVLSLAEEEILSICWEVRFLLTYTSFITCSCKHSRYFLEKCRIGTYSLYSLMVCFLRCLLCPFYPCYKKTW